MNILFVAAENGALPGGKVGGIGDVVRDLPSALAARACRVTVATPSHGFLHHSPGARRMGSCPLLFRGSFQEADLYTVDPAEEACGVVHVVIHHPALAAFDTNGGRPALYAHDPSERPYFTDASRFAFFSAALAAAIAGGRLGPFDLLHLHDWHAALVALLARCHPAYRALGRLPIVFSIHNLAFQGVRPLRGSDSSLEAWFPELSYDWRGVADPRWPDCINPMAVGIRLADRVHTVSPSYAAEILKPDRKPVFYGGEGLEADLALAHEKGRLKGILNGCHYPPALADRKVPFADLLDMVGQETIAWSGNGDLVPAALFIAFARAMTAAREDFAPDVLLTSVARVGEQKLLLLRQPTSDGRSALEAILAGIGVRGCYIMLGSGDRDYERWLTAVAARHANFIFLNGYSDRLAGALYGAGDLFVMPSSFEPCGLSQMLAMREGQPCVVHAVGGLKDTVRNGVDGFTFEGQRLEAQTDRLVATTLDAVALKRRQPAAWQKICRKAAAARFTWPETAQRYLTDLYPRIGRDPSGGG